MAVRRASTAKRKDLNKVPYIVAGRVFTAFAKILRALTSQHWRQLASTLDLVTTPY